MYWALLAMIYNHCGVIIVIHLLFCEFVLPLPLSLPLLPFYPFLSFSLFFLTPFSLFSLSSLAIMLDLNTQNNCLNFPAMCVQGQQRTSSQKRKWALDWVCLIIYMCVCVKLSIHKLVILSLHNINYYFFISYSNA